MSTCPTKDIHSLYLDNEMPEIYKTEYESHVNNCPKCKNELERLKSLRALLHSDDDVELSDAALKQSFERLQLKMKYSKNVGRSEKRPVNFRYFIPAAAAAAVLALFVPLRLQKNDGNSSSLGSVASSLIKSAAEAQNVTFDSGRSVVISGNIHESVIPQQNNAQMGMVHNASTNSAERNLIRNVNVFPPQFAEERTKSIRITVPDMNTIPVTVEIQFPDAVTQVPLSEFDQ